MEKEIILHTGMPKSASTYLQEEIFPNLNGIHFTHLQYYAKGCPIANLILRMRYANPITFDIEKEKEMIWKYINQIREDKVLISWEGLYGDPFNNHMNSYFLYNSLRTLFPNAKVLLIIRKQDSLIESLYLQTLHQYHSVSVNHFLNYNIKTKEFGKFEPSWWQGMNIDVRSFNLYQIAKTYIDLYGKDEVSVIPYEEILNNKEIFLSFICDFIGVETFIPIENSYQNRSYSMRSAKIARYMNRFMDVGFNSTRWIKRNSFLDPMILLKKVDKKKYKKAKFLSEEIRLQIMKLHRSSNVKLNELTQFDLENFGYIAG